MNRHPDHSFQDCPIAQSIKKIGDVTTLLILKSILETGSIRFCELEKTIPKVSTATLSDRLKRMVEWGWLSRKVEPSAPPTVSYSLTKTGLQLEPVVKSIIAFADQDKRPIPESQA